MSETAELVLESNSGIAQAEVLSKQLEELFQKSAAVVIDGSSVTRVDTSVMQLFCSFFSTMDQTGVSVTWKDPSETLCSSARTLGLTTQLGL